jgi:hypothetical protein
MLASGWPSLLLRLACIASGVLAAVIAVVTAALAGLGLPDRLRGRRSPVRGISTGFGRFLELTPELRPSANSNLFIFAPLELRVR